MEGYNLKRYKIKITICAFGIWQEKIQIVSEQKLLELENSKNGTYAIDILEVLE